MEAIQAFIGDINGLVWGPPMLVMILGVGLFLSLGLKLMPILKRLPADVAGPPCQQGRCQRG